MISRHQEGQLLQLLTDAQTTMAWLFEHRARHLGLNRPQWRVLSGLHGNEGITQSELSEKVSIARSPLGKIVDRLEAMGYVERRNDPDDRRIHRLFLTPAVEPLVLPVRTIVSELERTVLENLPRDADFVEQLEIISGRLRNLIQHAKAA